MAGFFSEMESTRSVITSNAYSLLAIEEPQQTRSMC